MPISQIPVLSRAHITRYEFLRANFTFQTTLRLLLEQLLWRDVDLSGCLLVGFLKKGFFFVQCVIFVSVSGNEENDPQSFLSIPWAQLLLALPHDSPFSAALAGGM